MNTMEPNSDTQCQACLAPLPDAESGARMRWAICETCQESESSFEVYKHHQFAVGDWVRLVLTISRERIQENVLAVPCMFSWEEQNKTHIRPFPSLLTAASKDDMQLMVRGFHTLTCQNPQTHVAFLLGHYGQVGIEGRRERFIWFLTFSRNPVFQMIVTLGPNGHVVSKPVLMKNDEDNPCV